MMTQDHHPLGTTACAVAATIVIALSGVRASAQSATVRTDVVQEWTQMKETMRQLAEAMPEEKLGFRPVPGLRTYGEQLLHVADDNVKLLKLVGAQVPAPAIDLKATTKTAIVKALLDSYDYGSAVLAQQTDASITDAVHLSNWNGTRGRLVWSAIGHAWDEYGVMTVYLRLNGIVPPASRAK
jgi:DinB family protein